MRTEVATNHLRVTPGVPVILDVEVTNTADVIDGVTATIQGLDSAWVSLVVPVISLFPEASATLQVRIDLPTNCLAGEYLVSVLVNSIVDPARFSSHEFWLSVEPLVAASLTMHPSIIVGGKAAVFQAAIANEGNVTADLVINALDETRILTCVAHPATVSVPPGETHFVDVHVKGPRPWFGQAVTRPVKIDVTGPEVELEAKASFTQKPRIPRGVLTFLILSSIVALWATVFLVVVSALREQAPPSKAIATNFNEGGNDQVNLTAVAATMSGAVTADSTGNPVPRITVEASRVTSDGALDLVGSTGTDDEGAFSLGSLLPGTYKLRFSGNGFDEIWYPAATDSGSAAAITLAPKAERDDLNVVVQGRPGSLAGLIVAPDNAGATPAITVTITRVVEELQPGEEPPAGVQPPVDAGSFVQADLITPADYTVRVESEGFDTRTFTETLAAGQNKVINTITLGAALGEIRGLVTDGNGAPLGGVEVTARSGDFEKVTKTPTSGNVGQFVLEGLETPQTYVLTFALAGHADQTLALSLDSGENLVRNVQILGGTGSVRGTASDTAGNLLGGVTVSVVRGAFTAETSTLTSSTAVGQQGAYSITGLPTPGSYTFTFSSPGFDSQTLRVDLPTGGSANDVNVVLPRSSGSVAGTVTSGGTAVADVIVELSTGTSPRSTATASAPAGAYRFTEVPPGSYTLTFRRTGLTTRVVIVEVVGDQTTQRNIDLPAAP